jgi:uncharacterized protein YbaP (TraB family)
MHLQDRDLFTFGDSIYHALESSDGFALELNPSDMMDTLFKMFAKTDNSPLIKNILSKSEYEKIADILSKKLKIPADQITVKKIAAERRNWLSKNRKKNDMPTFMDMYFYTIAQNQGKYVGGIEDLEDQIGLMDDIGGLDIEDYLKEDNESRLKDLVEMKTIYLNRDLDKIRELTYGSSGSTFHDEILVKRNLKMARRIDSLAQIRNTFFALGAAHLPGDSGVIALLMKHGFVVEPVTSSQYLKPEEYHYTKKKIKWVNVEDDHKISSVKMPGQPTLVTLSDIIPIQMYMDLSNTFCYGISVIPMATDVNNDSVFSQLIDNYKSQGYEIISTKKIVELGAKGLDIQMSAIDEGYLHFKILIKSNKLFMLVFGAQDKEKLAAPEAVKFFTSLTINDINLTKPTTWQLFSDKQNAFSISLPATPISKFDQGTDKTFFDFYTYTASDYSDGSYYIMLVKNSLPGYFINSDSLIFEAYKKNFTETGDTHITYVSEISINGCHGYKILAEKTSPDIAYAYQMYMIFRGNRIYMPMTISEKGKENSAGIQNFFNSFTLLPFEKSEWKQYTSSSNNFTAWTPSDFELKEIDSSSTEVLNKQTFLATDKKSVVNYSIEIQPYSKYYWSNSDSVFFKKLTRAYQSDEDSLIYYHQLKGDNAGAEVLIKLHGSGLYKKLRTLVNGDTLYTLFSYFPEELKDNKNVNLFFSKFKFVNPYPNTLFKNKQDQLQAALLNADNDTRNNALEALDQIDFAKNDLTFLHSAWLHLYPADSNQYRSINYHIAERITDLQDPLTIDFIGKNYSRFNTTQPELQMNMLEVLANFKTERSYALLKKLLLLHPPTTGSVYDFSDALMDSLLLSKNLFPEVSKLYADPLFGSALIRLTVDLIDSNKISIKDIRNAALIYSLSKKQLTEIKNNPEEYPLYNYSVIDILQKLNSKQAIEILKSFMKSGMMEIQYDAAIALAKINQPVPPLVFYSIAANNEYRTELYASLKKINKAGLFPNEFLTQQKFAEAYLYNYASENEDSITIQAKGDRTAKVNGQLQRYYLFKLNTVYEDETTSHLAICGPFDLNKKNVGMNEDIDVHVFYDEEYNPEATEKLFQQFFKEGSGE